MELKCYQVDVKWAIQWLKQTGGYVPAYRHCLPIPIGNFVLHLPVKGQIGRVGRDGPWGKMDLTGLELFPAITKEDQSQQDHHLITSQVMRLLGAGTDNE